MTEMQLLALEASDATVVITGLVLVMAMLVVLCLIIMVEGKLFDRGEQLAHRTGAPRVAKATQEAAARAKAFAMEITGAEELSGFAVYPKR